MFYRIIKAIFKVIVMVLFDLKVEGTEKLPKEGPVIVCANHISWWDPPLVGIILDRPVHFMAKKELFKYPVFGYLLRKLNAFPVDRQGVDIAAIRKGLSILEKGDVIGIFPEGTRQKTGESLGVAHPGAALLALRTKAPVFPIAIRGKYGFRRRVRVLCGEPFTLEPEQGRFSLNLQAGSMAIMEKIRGLWERLDPNEAA